MQSKLYYSTPAPEVPLSKSYRLWMNGEEIFIYTCDIGHFALVSAEGKVNVDIEVMCPFKDIKIRPIQSGITFEQQASHVTFEIDAPQKISLEVDGDIRHPLFVLVNPPELEKPDPKDPKVTFFKSGGVHHVGEMTLSDNETLYIEEGAVVHGYITALDAQNIRIAGRGILDGSLWRSEGHLAYGDRQQMIKPIQCTDVTIEGITVVDGSNWHVVPIACQKVEISNVNILSLEGTGDGIDIVGSEDVTVDHCFIRAKDDCVAIKAVDYHHELGLKDVRNVRVKNSVLWNAEWGNALEIGYETRCNEISDIVFSNCDVIHCEFEGHQSGGTFTIHNGDRATIRNVIYENIRVEDSQEKLIDIKILYSKYSKDKQRGTITDIYFKDICVIDGLFPVSIIRGYDDDHMIQNIQFENLEVHGNKVNNANEARMVVELSKGIHFY